MNPTAIARPLLALASLAALALGLAACAAPAAAVYTGTGQARIEPGDSFVGAKLHATGEAERHARNAILEQVMDERFAAGVTVREAMVVDPVIRGRVYDTVRSAHIAKRETDKTGEMTIVVELGRDVVAKLLSDPEYQPRMP